MKNNEKEKNQEESRLNVFMANAGYCSRRMASEFIKKGEVTINHAVVRNPGYKVRSKDTVRHKKVVIKAGNIPFITIALNKPVGVITSAVDEKHRQTVLDLLDKKIKARVFPIGRLDLNTSGILLLTNDGQLAQKLAHPKFNVKKVYQVTLAKDLSTEHFEKIKKGLRLKDGLIKVDHITVGMQKNKARVTLHSGRYRIVRRIFESLGYTVRKLDRISFAGIEKRGLAAGEYRFLTHKETKELKAQ